MDTRESDMLRALRAIVQVLDGSQPIDPTGALFVAQSAIKKATEGMTDAPVDQASDLRDILKRGGMGAFLDKNST